MDNIIWKVRMQKDIDPWKGQPVLCIWNEKRRVYEVFHRGDLCGVVQEISAKRNAVTGDFFSGRIISREGMEMEILIQGKAAQAAILLPGNIIQFVKCCRAA